MKTPESWTKDKLKKWFKQNGYYYFLPVQMGYGARALDFFVCARGQFWGVEAKKEGVEKPTPKQRQTMREIREAGGRTFLVSMRDGELYWLEVQNGMWGTDVIK